MTFSIDEKQGGDGNRVTYSIRVRESGFGTLRAEARDLQEVGYALEHYFHGRVYEDYDYTKHTEHAKVCDCCPLCRGKSK